MKFIYEDGLEDKIYNTICETLNNGVVLDEPECHSTCEYRNVCYSLMTNVVDTIDSCEVQSLTIKSTYTQEEIYKSIDILSKIINDINYRLFFVSQSIDRDKYSYLLFKSCDDIAKFDALLDRLRKVDLLLTNFEK